MKNVFYNTRKSLHRKLALTTTLVFCLAVAFAQAEEAVTDSALAKLPDIKVLTKTVNYSPYRLEYQLAIKQPVDHADTAKGFFYQQLHLIHRGFFLPMVMETEGYDGRPGGNELERILNCNDLNVEFRYFAN